VSPGRPVPAFGSLPFDEAISFCTTVIDSSGVANKIEALLARKTGRPRQMKVRAILVALLLLALDDRPLHIKAATKLLFCKMPASWRARLGINGDATNGKTFLARYRQARYLFHLALSALDPSPGPKDRVLAEEELAGRRKKLSTKEVAARQARLEQVLADLVEASVRVCSADELAGFDGSVGLDATPVPLWSRGPSVRRGTCASDPDGGWYVREADHREGTGPEGKPRRKIYWALEATIVTWGGRPARCRPTPTWSSAPCSAGRARTLPALAPGCWLLSAPGAGQPSTWARTAVTPRGSPSTSTCRCGRSVTPW
jgi:hypothetical protein